MRKLMIPLCVFTAVFAFSGTSMSALIVDTGTPTVLSWTDELRHDEWYAGRFSISQSYDIYAMRGYLGWGDGQVNIAIYHDSGLPSGSPLFTRSFHATHTPAWQGVAGYSGRLTAGSYWIAFEVAAGSAFDDGGLFPNPVSPLGRYARSSNEGRNWSILSAASFATQIEGTPVPLPASLWLIAPGLLGVAAVRRRIGK